MTPIPRPTSNRNRHHVVEKLLAAHALGQAATFAPDAKVSAEVLRRVVRNTADFNDIRVKTKIENGLVIAWIVEVV